MSTPGNRRTSDSLARSPSSLGYRKRVRNSLSYRRRTSVRKSLKFDNESARQKSKTHKGAAASSSKSGASSLESSHGQEDDSRVPPIPTFWDYLPPPPPLEKELGPTVNRRSLRLRTKNQFAIAQISDSQSPTLRSEPAASERLLRPKTMDVMTFDQNSVHSDYGTASENSLYFHPSNRGSYYSGSSTNALSDIMRRSKSTVPCQSNNSEPSCSQSVGYASDIDDCMSNLSIDDVIKTSHDSRKWDSEDEYDDNGKDDEWEDVPETNGSHLSLKDINLGNLKTSFKQNNGIIVIIPLEGYEVLRTVKCINRRSLMRTERRRAVRYDLRNRPSHHLENTLSIQIFQDINIEEYFLKEGLRIFQVSPVISIQPHEVTFCALYPAVVQIPLKTHPSSGDEVHCLYSRYSTENLENDYCKIPWKSVEAGKFSITNGKVNFETYDFGLFVLIIRPKCPTSSKTIRARVGGKLFISDLPSVEVNFPKEATKEDSIEAVARIFFDTEESVSEVLARRLTKLAKAETLEKFDDEGDAMDCNDEELVQQNSLATPIIQLEPHGIQFQAQPVIVTLPVPDYEKILALTSSKLSIWQSNTGVNESAQWERVDVEYKISQQREGGETVMVVSFPVTHFSFFKGVWETISSCLYDARIGMFYYFVSFAMKCQANMEEYIEGDKNNKEESKEKEQRRFGLEVNVFQADKSWPAMPTYKYKVGQSNPKLIKPGRLVVKLRSQIFIPDVDAGEDTDMVKEEDNFRGRDFEKQFACKFKEGHMIDRGPFGKVLVTRHASPRQKEQLIFEFNLQKHGNESETAPSEDHDDQWGQVALTELAHTLFLTEGENWRLFAKEIGMTKQEIKDAKLKTDDDPFQKMVAYYRQRGGTAAEFVKALYVCNRTLKINGGYSPESSKHSRSSNGSSGRGSLSSNNMRLDRFGGSHDSDTSGTHTSQDSGLAPPGRKRPHSSIVARSSGSQGGTSTLSKRSKLDLSTFAKPNSDSVSDADGEDSDNDRVPGPSSRITNTQKNLDDSELHKNDQTKLENTFLWDISVHLNNSNWRALGRSLGLEESVLIDVDHGHSKTSFRECAYQMLLAWREKFPSKCTFGTLYNALNKEGMNAAAKKMTTIEQNNS